MYLSSAGMEANESTAMIEQSGIQCIEVLIARKYVVNKNNLFWTLSVYSLENQPVKNNRAFHDAEVFHFMMYDWKRTIKQLLDNHQVPYSIIQLFKPDTIYSDKVGEGIATPDNEGALLSAVDSLSEKSGSLPESVNPSEISEEEDTGVIH